MRRLLFSILISILIFTTAVADELIVYHTFTIAEEMLLNSLSYKARNRVSVRISGDRKVSGSSGLKGASINTKSCTPDIPDLSSGCSSGDDAALVFFVVIGVVVVVAWVGYALYYIVNAMFNQEDYNPWFQVEGVGTYIFGRSRSNENNLVERNGFMSGMKFTFATDYNKNFDLGLVGEVGYHYLLEDSTENSIALYHGGYGMMGPVLFLGGTGVDRSHLFVELLGGTSTRSNIGVMAVARIGFTYSLPNRIVFSIHGGSIYLSLKPVTGMLSAADEFNFISGVSLGYRF